MRLLEIVILVLQCPRSSGFVVQSLRVKHSLSVLSKDAKFPTYAHPKGPICDWAEEIEDDGQIMDATIALLDNSGSPGSLSREEIEDFFPLMMFWSKSQTADGASRVERLLSRLEAEVKAGNMPPPNMYKYYTLSVDAWGKAGYPEKAEKILFKMKELGKSDKSLSPSRVTYHCMMHAYAKKGDMENALALLDHLEASSDIDIVDYNVVLAGYAKLGEARQAENLLARMISQCRKQKNNDLNPDICSYNTLLDAWSKSDEPGRGIRSKEILSTLIERSDDGEPELAPNELTFSAAMTAVARSGGTMEQIEELWMEAEKRGFASDPYLISILLDCYATNSNVEKAADVLAECEKRGTATLLAYNTVLKGLKGKGDVDAAEKIFQKMASLKLADAFSYCTMIAMHADRGNEKSAERADELLSDMRSAGLVPNVATLNACMNAWTKCGKVEVAARRLSEIEEAYYSGVADGTNVNVISYTTLMTGFVKVGDLRAVEDTFERMMTMYKSGNDDAQPNSVAWSVLINSIARSKEPEAAAKAQEILFRMKDEGVVPNTRLVTSVIDSWQKSGASDAGERAEDLLEWLLELYEEEGDVSLQPNEYTFNAVISAWARTRKFGKAARAKAVLNRMIELKGDGTISASPNTHCYTAVINSCAYCERDSLEKRQALRIAIETYKELLVRIPDGANQVTFSTLVTAFRNLLPPDETRAAAIETIFKKCADDGHVSDRFLRQVQSSLSEDQLHKLIGVELLSEGRVDVEQIPSTWRRNVEQMSARVTP